MMFLTMMFMTLIMKKVLVTLKPDALGSKYPDTNSGSEVDDVHHEEAIGSDESADDFEGNTDAD